jgi:hypothetical protein
MDFTIPTIYVAFGAIIAAIIAASVSFVSLVISKESKISEFRHQWIQELRNCVSDLVSQIEIISAWRQVHKVSDKLSYEDLQESFKDFSENYLTTFNSIALIKLRLNPEEHHELLRLIKNLENNYSKLEFLLEADKVNKQIELIINETQNILKDEWVTVKTGEKPFVILKKGLLFGAIIALVSSAIVLIRLAGG